MARKKAIPNQGTASITEEPVQAIIQKLPEKVPSSTLRFLGLVVLSLTLSSLGYSASAPFLAGDLSGVSRRVDEWWQVVGLLGWRGAELAVGWWGGYDGMLSIRLSCMIWNRQKIIDQSIQTTTLLLLHSSPTFPPFTSSLHFTTSAPLRFGFPWSWMSSPSLYLSDFFVNGIPTILPPTLQRAQLQTAA